MKSIEAEDYTDSMEDDEVSSLRTWDQRILALIDSGIDPKQVEESLRRTPTERLRRMQDMVRFIEKTRDRRRTAA